MIWKSRHRYQRLVADQVVGHSSQKLNNTADNNILSRMSSECGKTTPPPLDGVKNYLYYSKMCNDIEKPPTGQPTLIILGLIIIMYFEQ